MRRQTTNSFVPFAMESFRAGAPADGQAPSHSKTATAVLELDEPALDAGWEQSESSSLSCEPATAGYREFLRAERLGEFAPSERTPKPAADPSLVVGTWRLVSSEATVVDNGITEVTVTENPKGYLILTPWERMMTVCIGGDGERPKIPTSQADLSELWRTMLAYTGKYRVEGNELVTTVDVAWYEL
jgi:hypothetical protein